MLVCRPLYCELSSINHSHTKHDKPLGVLHTFLIGLGITKGGNFDLVGLVDFLLGTVTDEHGLSTPLDDDLYSIIRVSHQNTGEECGIVVLFERTFLPSGIAPRPTSTLAWARTSAEADMLTKKSVW